jgi:hypothetical protein
LKHDKKISIHGAAVGKPMAHNTTNEISPNRPQYNTPLQHAELNKIMNYYGEKFDDEENEYYDHSILGITNRNPEADLIDDMSLLNNTLTVNNILNTSKKQLPPIEKLLNHKVSFETDRIYLTPLYSVIIFEI